MGAGSSCNTRDIVDPYPGNDVTNGLKRADSEGCSNCNLIIDNGNTVSTVDLHVLDKGVRITPVIPLTVTFNTQQYKITEIDFFYPAPIRVEGTNADAVMRFKSLDGDGLELFLPLASSVNMTTAPSDFLSKIAHSLPDTTKTTTVSSVSVGQNWSLASLISPNDPYFTWINADYERYVKYMIPCSQRLMGWRPLRGSRAIYMANPTVVPDSDMAILRASVLRMNPADVFKTLPYTYFYPPNEPCPDCKTPTKAKTSAPSPMSAAFFNWVIAIVVIILFCIAVIVGVLMTEQKGSVFEMASNLLRSVSSFYVLMFVFGLLIILALTVAGIAKAK